MNRRANWQDWCLVAVLAIEVARRPGFMLFVIAVFLLFYWLA